MSTIKRRVKAARTHKYFVDWKVGTFIVVDADQPATALLSTMKYNKTSWVILRWSRRRGSLLFYAFGWSEVGVYLKGEETDRPIHVVLELSETYQSHAVREINEANDLEIRKVAWQSANRVIQLDKKGGVRRVGELALRAGKTAGSKRRRGAWDRGLRGGGTSSAGGSLYERQKRRAAQAFRREKGKAVHFLGRKRALKRSRFDRSIALSPKTVDFNIVRVFYATDRARESSGQNGSCVYANQRSADGKVLLGTCDVSLPNDHRMGNIEAPSIWKLQIRANPQKHIVLLNILEKGRDVYFREMREKVAQSSERSAFVFIHGYNVSFADAARRAAQLAYDLKFPGAAIFYSWPSKAAVKAYASDEESIQLTEKQLVQFLTDVVRESGAQLVHLIAHSMGNRALVRALDAIVGRIEVAERPKFTQIVLTAPDVNREEFLQLAEAVRSLGERVTLYASKKDVPLFFSKRLHEYSRAGYAGKDLIVIPPTVDTIDASTVRTDFLAHSYFGNNKTVLSDLFDLIRHGHAPDDRPRLKPKTHSNGKYWTFAQ